MGRIAHRAADNKADVEPPQKQVRMAARRHDGGLHTAGHAHEAAVRMRKEERSGAAARPRSEPAPKTSRRTSHVQWQIVASVPSRCAGGCDQELVLTAGPDAGAFTLARRHVRGAHDQIQMGQISVKAGQGRHRGPRATSALQGQRNRRQSQFGAGWLAGAAQLTSRCCDF